jgi:hypothetical protein
MRNACWRGGSRGVPGIERELIFVRAACCFSGCAVHKSGEFRWTARARVLRTEEEVVMEKPMPDAVRGAIGLLEHVESGLYTAVVCDALDELGYGAVEQQHGPGGEFASNRSIRKSGIELTLETVTVKAETPLLRKLRRVIVTGRRNHRPALESRSSGMRRREPTPSRSFPRDPAA